MYVISLFLHVCRHHCKDTGYSRGKSLWTMRGRLPFHCLAPDTLLREFSTPCHSPVASGCGRREWGPASPPPASNSCRVGPLASDMPLNTLAHGGETPSVAELSWYFLSLAADTCWYWCDLAAANFMTNFTDCLKEASEYLWTTSVKSNACALW